MIIQTLENGHTHTEWHEVTQWDQSYNDNTTSEQWNHTTESYDDELQCLSYNAAHEITASLRWQASGKEKSTDFAYTHRMTWSNTMRSELQWQYYFRTMKSHNRELRWRVTMPQLTLTLQCRAWNHSITEMTLTSKKTQQTQRTQRRWHTSIWKTGHTHRITQWDQSYNGRTVKPQQRTTMTSYNASATMPRIWKTDFAYTHRMSEQWIHE